MMLDRLRAGEFASWVASINSARANLDLDQRLVMRAV